MAEGGFDFQKFIDDSKQVLMAPKEYFAAMPKEGGFGEPVIKALIYGAVAGVFTLIWGLLKLSAASAMLGGAAGAGAGITSLIVSPIAAVIGLFIGAVLVLILSAICGGSTNYEANARVVAATMILMPINAVLSFTGGLNFYLGVAVSLVVSLFGLWLLLNALVNALGGKEGVAKVVVIVLAVLTLLSSYFSIRSYRYLSSGANVFMKGSDRVDDKEAREKAQKVLDEIMKKAQEEAAKQENK